VLTVTRWSAADDTVHTSAPVGVRLTRASIGGHIYYWDVGETTSSSGRILRVDAYDGARDVVVESPPAPPSTSRHCMGCHSISPDGRYMAVMLGGGDPASRGAVYDLTTDLSGATPPAVVEPQWSDPSGVRFATATWSPDGTRLFYTDAATHLVDALTGTRVSATGLPTGNFFSPAWSPDGSTIALSSMLAGVTWFHTYTQGDLVTVPVTGPDAFGAPRTIHEGASLASSPEGGSADSHPTWSPDSHLVVFEHGDHSASDAGSGLASTMRTGALYAIKPDGSGLVRLERALTGSTAHRDYWPTFSPFVSPESGGESATYYWVAFTSTRAYGNGHVGTAAHERRQIWVTAIRAGAGTDEDPSSVPYWLPGQDVGGQNMAAQWAPVACIATSDECAASSECCSGNCALDDAGGYTCQPPPPEECHLRGATCGTAADCCDGLECTGHICIEQII